MTCHMLRIHICSDYWCQTTPRWKVDRIVWGQIAKGMVPVIEYTDFGVVARIMCSEQEFDIVEKSDRVIRRFLVPIEFVLNHVDDKEQLIRDLEECGLLTPINN